MCFLAVLVIVCVFSPDLIVSHCTTKSCDNGDNEANVMTLVSRMQQQQLAEQTETIISLKQEVAQLEEGRFRDHGSIEQLQQDITLFKEVQNTPCKYVCHSYACILVRNALVIGIPT